MKQLIYISLLLLGLTSCVKKPKDQPFPINEGMATQGLLILNEGAWNQNNSSLTFAGLTGEVIHNVYQGINGQVLGDVANDMKQYGGKIYIVVNESSNVVVLDAKTLLLVKRIPLFDGNQPRSPRNIAFFGPKAYITAFDGHVLRLDTASLVVDNMVAVGRNPEGLVVQNDKLYVSNSGGLDYPNYDKTVSVIDLTTFQEIKKLTVGLNPGSMAADEEGEVYVVARGNHTDILPQLVRIDATTDVVMDTISDKVFSIKITGNKAFVSYNNAAFNAADIRVFDPFTEKIASTPFADLSALQGFYGFDIIDEGVACFDAKNFTTKGEVFLFNQSGQLMNRIPCGFIPSAAIQKE